VPEPAKYLCSCEAPADILMRPHESVRAAGIQPMYAACYAHADRAFLYFGDAYKVLRIDIVSQS